MDTAYRVGPLHSDDLERLGDYALVGRLGAGGMGVVYLGRGPRGAHAAIKVVNATLAREPEFRQRFYSEVARAREVPPFCTAEVLGADLDHDPPYVVFEYVDAPSLAEVVEGRGPLRAAALQALAIGVASALVGIHGAGVIHRDLKPENVLLPPGNPKVIDFGIARMSEATSRHTAPAQAIGTIAYMAPERLDATSQNPVTAAADVFAWGCLVAYAGLGHSPFLSDSATTTAARILTQPPDLGKLPEPLRGVVDAALVKEPVLRPTARELLTMLLDGVPAAEATAAGPPSRSARVAAAQGKPRSGLRRRWRVAGAAVAVLSLAIVAVFLALDPGAGGRSSAEDPNSAHYIKDALRAPSQFPSVETESHLARCEVADVLTVVRIDRDSYMCPGPEVIVKQGFTARVTVVLRSKGTCAAMVFNWNAGRGGNLLHVCQDAISVSVVTGATTKTLGTLRAARPIFLNQPAQIRIVVADGVVQVFRGGGRAGEVRLPADNPTEGKFRLGIEVGETGGRSPFMVSYSDLEVAAV